MIQTTYRTISIKPVPHALCRVLFVEAPFWPSTSRTYRHPLRGQTAEAPDGKLTGMRASDIVGDAK
jgi:hypothetical protein